MSSPALRVENLGKRYQLGLTHAGSLGEVANRWSRRLRGLPPVEAPVDAAPGSFSHEQDGDFWALRDVNFEVQPGEVVGIIGRNGAGKSTLLKILSRVTAPTTGSVQINGRVGSLLEVGTGFHPELTGRENVYMNATLLGMSKREVNAKLDEIVDFAGVEKFLDTPVKRYSSGMKVRLGFAVAAHLEPEVLIVDEVLSVGDAEFQKKCLGKMRDVAGEGRTVLFVSHNMAAVQSLCSVAHVIEEGRIVQSGSVSDAVAWYFHQALRGTIVPLKDRTDREGDGAAHCEDVWLEDADGRRVAGTQMGADTTIAVKYQIINEFSSLQIAVGIYGTDGTSLLHLDTSSNPPECPLKKSGIARCPLPRFPLVSGQYRINISIRHQDGLRADRVEHALIFDVAEGDYFGTGKLPPHRAAVVVVPHEWDVVTDCANDEAGLLA